MKKNTENAALHAILEGILKGLSEKVANQEEEGKKEESKRTPVIKVLVDSTDAGEDGELHTLEGEATLTIAIKRTVKDGEEGLKAASAIVGTMGIEELACMIEVVDGIRDQLVEKFVEKNLKGLGEVGLSIDPVTLFENLMGGKR
jgi:hypothetical protein